MQKQELFINSLLIISFIIALVSYQFLPDMIPTHWGINGSADAYSPKSFGAFYLPIVLLFMVFLYKILPFLDPMKQNTKANREKFSNTILVIIVFLFYIYFLSISAAFHNSFNMTLAIIPGIAGLMYFIGYNMKDIKPNWFFGIRVPWTLHDKEIWKKTHDLASEVFRIFGMAMLAIWLLSVIGVIDYILLPILFFSFLLGVVIFLTIYPYYLWRSK